jgi:Zn-dependent protease with chaperone function
MRQPLIATALSLAITACATSYQTPTASPITVPVSDVPPDAQAPARSIARAVGEFRAVSPQVERAAEVFCREELPGRHPRYCDFKIRLIEDRRAPPNAFQTLDRDGRPLIVVTVSLLAEVGSADEIAFVMSHEAGHHIAGHLSKQQSTQMAGALIMGAVASAIGGDGSNQQSIREAMNLGSFVGGRVYSQRFELEADLVGAYVTARAGYDPERGARIFARPKLTQDGAGLLSTHPASPQRLATVRRAAADIRAQQAQGRIPRPNRS